MKKRIPVFLLCVLLLTGSVFAAGGADDPLISRSYLSDTFLPEVRAALDAIADKAIGNYRRGENSQSSPAMKSLTLHPGESLHLKTGEYFVVTSGTSTLSVMRGRAVNATQGWETSGGAARIGNRYIICEDAEAYLDANTDTEVTVSSGAELDLGCPFTDVKRKSWYGSNVINAYALDLVSGTSATTFSPSGTLTYAGCIKLASSMHQLSHDGAATALRSGDVWYRPYVEYALENGLLDAELPNYQKVINRREFVQMFYRAMPVSSYEQRNDIADNSIPDVTVNDPCAKEVYTFYRAGILSGFSQNPGYAEHAFGPNATITRAEVVAIMDRMLNPEMRAAFTMK